MEQLPVGIDGLTEIKGFVPDKIELLQDGRNGLCDRLLNSTTVEDYESAKGQMDEFVSAKKDRAF